MTTATECPTFTCSKCGQAMDIIYRSGKRGRRCKACVAIQQREYRRRRASIIRTALDTFRKWWRG